MPGLQDESEQRELPQAQSRDGARQADSPDTGDRQGRGSAEDLGRRLERLPPGHPSSPYHDDGTPKPPLVRLKNLELPLPGEEREPNGGASRNLAVSPAVIPRADDRPGAVETEARHETDSELAAQDRQPVVREPDLALPDLAPERLEQADRPPPSDGEPADREPADSEHADTEPADPEPAGRESADSEAADSEPADSEPAGREPAPWAPTDREHETAVGEPEPATDRVADLDDEPATQDQPAIVEEPAPGPVEQPPAKPAERLTPEQVRIAVRAHGQCRLAEGRSVFGSYGDSGLTPAMRRIEEQLDHGELAPDTEKYALKSLDRFQEKLAKLIARNPDKTPEELAHDIHDGVRYTFVFDEDRYYESTCQVHSKLEEQGFHLEFRRNTWTDLEYKGVNSRWHDLANNMLFEVQFHTTASWNAKQHTHDTYVKISDTNTPSAERTQLRNAQKEISASISLPPRCMDIPDYREEG